MSTKPTTVVQYLKSLPEDRREVLQAVRKVILDNLDDGYAEGMQYGMIGYFVPHSVYPAGYHCDPKQPVPYVGLASQKNYMALYLFCVYTAEQEQRRFREAWTKTGRRLDMGKSCVRFRKLDDVALDVIGDTIRRTPAGKFIARYEKMIGDAGRKRPNAKESAAKKAPAEKAPAKKKAAKKKAESTKTTAKRKTTSR